MSQMPSAKADIIMHNAKIIIQELAACVLDHSADTTLEELAGQAIAAWDTQMAAAAFQYLIRQGHTAAGAHKILGTMTGTEPEEWERLVAEAEADGLLEVWI